MDSNKKMPWFRACALYAEILHKVWPHCWLRDRGFVLFVLQLSVHCVKGLCQVCFYRIGAATLQDAEVFLKVHMRRSAPIFSSPRLMYTIELDVRQLWYGLS
jgi:hypothetical protein